MYCCQALFNCCTCFSIQSIYKYFFNIQILKQYFTVHLSGLCLSSDHGIGLQVKARLITEMTPESSFRNT